MRFDALHPAVLAEKYDRNYRPYFIGQRGAASLNQYLGMQQMLPELQNGTAVYRPCLHNGLLKRGIILQLFSSSHNYDQLSSFLSETQTDANSQYAAQRILEMKPEITMKSQLSKVAKGQELNSLDKTYIQFMAELNKREDALFSPLAASNNANYEKKVLPYLKELPTTLDEALDQVAVRDAEAHTKSNDFGSMTVSIRNVCLRRLVNLKVSRKIFRMKFHKNTVTYSWCLNQFVSQILMSFLSSHLLIASGWLIRDLVKKCMMLRFLKSVINWKVKALLILQTSQKMEINLTLCKTPFIWDGKGG